MADGISITDLEQKTEVTDNDNFAVDNGAITNKVTAKQIKDYMGPTYVKKSGDTMTGKLTVEPGVLIKDRAFNFNPDVPPSSNKYSRELSFGDNNTDNLGYVSLGWYSDGVLLNRLGVNRKSSDGTSHYNQIAIAINDDNVAFGLAPTPPSYAAGTEITTAAWVRALITEKTLVKDYVTERWSDGNGNWYEVYASGWVRQGGFIGSGYNVTTVQLFKPFANNKYNAQATCYQDSGYGGNPNKVGLCSKTTTTFNAVTGFGAEGTGFLSFNWLAEGQGA